LVLLLEIWCFLHYSLLLLVVLYHMPWNFFQAPMCHRGTVLLRIKLTSSRPTLVTTEKGPNKTCWCLEIEKKLFCVNLSAKCSTAMCASRGSRAPKVLKLAVTVTVTLHSAILSVRPVRKTKLKNGIEIVVLCLIFSGTFFSSRVK
jgi:hypothetical protein